MALYRKLAVIGCGLIGSSLCRGVRDHALADEIAIADASPAARERIKALGLGDSVHAGAAEAVDGADLVIICTPVGVVGEVGEEIATALAPGVTVTDVGSVKTSVARALAPLASATVHVIPGHPIAGTEQSGPDAGFAALFRNRWTILTPLAGQGADYDAAVETLAEFWRGLGAQVDIMDETHHDLVLAVTSHLPHLIAYNIVGTAADLEEVTRSEVMKYSAGGFRDFTRIAASDPVMWRDIFLNNRDAVLEVVGRFTEDLQALSRAIRRGEGDTLEDLFVRTREIRRGVIDAGQENAKPNFGRDDGANG